MGEDLTGEYRIIGYLDDLEEAMRLGNRYGFKNELIDKMKSIHGEIVDTCSLLETEEHFDKLKSHLEILLGELKEDCLSGDEKSLSKRINQLEEQLELLIEYLNDESAN